MQIARDKVVSMDYTLTGDDGKVIDSSNGQAPLTYLQGAGNIIPGLEKALEGKVTGDNIKVSIPPEQGYGQRDPQMIQPVPRSAFQGVTEINPGMQFQANTNAGPRMVTIVKVDKESVTIDANHPLAGATLNFDVTIKDVRDASTEELQHGHAHAPGGHQH